MHAGAMRVHTPATCAQAGGMRTVFVQKRNLLRPCFHRAIRGMKRWNREAGEVRDGM